MKPGEVQLGVKMCGNCNPSIEAKKIVTKVSTALHAKVVPYEYASIRLTISSCSSACVEKKFPGDVTIRGREVDGVEYENDLDVIRAATKDLRKIITAKKGEQHGF